MEIWKDINGYEGVYQVSNMGNVRSFAHKKEGKVLKPIINNRGYAQYALCSKKYLAHRLVAESFIPNLLHYDTVNHKDCNPKNNKVTNLEWCSASENALYSVKKGGMANMTGVKNYRAVLNEDQVLEIVKLSGSLSRPEISKMLGIRPGMVHKVLNGETWSNLTGIPRKRYKSQLPKAA